MNKPLVKEDFAGVHVVGDAKIYIGAFEKPRTIRVLTTRSLDSDRLFRTVATLHNDQDTMLNHIAFRSDDPMDAHVAHQELVNAITKVNADRMATDSPVTVPSVNQAFDKIQWEINERFPKKRRL